MRAEDNMMSRLPAVASVSGVSTRAMSTPAFAQRMTETAARIGMNGTQFRNASGWHVVPRLQRRLGSWKVYRHFASTSVWQSASVRNSA